MVSGIFFEISPLVSFNYLKLTMPFHFLTFKCEIKGWNFPNINYSLSSIISTYHCSLKHPSKTDIHAHWFPTSQSSGEMGYKWNTIMNSETNLIGMQCECKVYSCHHSRTIRYSFIVLIGMLWIEQVYFCIMYFKGFYNLSFPHPLYGLDSANEWQDHALHLSSCKSKNRQRLQGSHSFR